MKDAPNVLRRNWRAASVGAVLAVLCAALAVLWWPTPEPVSVRSFSPPTAAQADVLRRSPLRLHYAGVYGSSREDDVIEIDVNDVEDGLLVLSSSQPLTWRLLGARASRLDAIVLAGRSRDRAVEGVPGGTPVYLLEGRDLHVHALRPRCDWRGNRVFRCSDWSLEHGTPFQRTESALIERLGHPIASVAFAYKADRLALPGTAIDRDLRLALEAENRQIAGTLERQRIRVEQEESQYQRYVAEQQEAVAALLEAHPTIRDGVDAAAVMDVHVIRVTDGWAESLYPMTDQRGFESYRRNEEFRPSPVTVRYVRAEDAVFVLLSVNEVVWRLETPGEGRAQAVLVSSSDLSTIEGLEPSVPLSVESPDLGSRDALRAPGNDADWTVLEEQFRERFPNAEIHRHDYRQTTIVLVR